MQNKTKKITGYRDRALEKRLGLKNVIFINVTGSITKKLMDSVWEEIKKFRSKNPRQWFCLVITTNGGDWDPARNFYSLTRLHKINLTTLAVDEINSAGITLLLSGKKRFSQAETEFMDHDVTQETEEKTIRGIHSHLSDMHLAKRVSRRIVAKNTNLGTAEVEKMYDDNDEIYFDAYEAKKMGFVHAILE